LGCSSFKYLEDGGTRIHELGRGDKKPLRGCEVDEFILRHYDDPKVRPLAEEIAQGPIPWALDDYDDKTSDDAELRAKIQTVIKTLDSLLKRKGHQSDQIPYQEGMGLGLMTYIGTPPGGFKVLGSLLRLGSPEAQFFDRAVEKLKMEMTERGLASYWDELEKIGGIRPNHGDYKRELSALEAIRANEAECTEHSKLLYSAYRMAGLDPFFNFVDFQRSEDRLVAAQLRENPDFFHVNVGLRLGDKTRIFDVTHLDPPHNSNGPLPLSLRQYLAMDFNNRGNFLKMNKENSQAEAVLIPALHLDPSSVLIYSHLADILIKKKELQKCFEIIDASLQRNPRNALAYLFRGTALEMLGKNEEALRDYNRAISIRPNHYLFFYARGSLFMRMQKERDGERDLVVTLQLAPENAGKDLMEQFFEGFKNKYKKVEEIDSKKLNRVVEELQLDPAKCEAMFYLATLYWRADQREYTLSILKGFVQKFLPIRDSLGKKGLSPDALEYLQYLHDFFPPFFWQDYEVKPLWDSLRLPF
jgi:tetratricopeptide (TPR) repeat protein